MNRRQESFQIASTQDSKGDQRTHVYCGCRPCAKHGDANQKLTWTQAGEQRGAHLHDVPLGLKAPLHAAGNTVTAHSCGGRAGSLEQSSSLFVSNQRAGSCVLLETNAQGHQNAYTALWASQALSR